jgi:ferredoxin
MPKVSIPQAGRSLEVHDGQAILLAAGIPYPHGCKSGRCGSCKSRLVSGEVDLLPHTPFALSTEERANGLILACRAQPLTDATVAWLGDANEIADIPVGRFEGAIATVEDATHDIKLIRVRLDHRGGFTFKAGQSSPGFRPGYVSDAVAADLGDLDGWKAYVAGPPAMVDDASLMLLERGLRADDIHADVFFTPEYGAS